MSVTRDDVRRLAALARLRLSDAEEARMAEELDRIVAYVEQLRALDTADVEPTTHLPGVRARLRPDTIVPRITREDALRNAPDADGVFVRVPKVID